MTIPLEEQLKRRTKDLNKLLSCCRQAIADCTESSEIAQDQARQVVSTVRHVLCHYEEENPAHSTEIQQWWKEIFQSLLPNGESQVQLDTSTEAQKRISRYEARFQQAWGLSSRELLQSRFTPAAGFPKKTMQTLVQFAERASCEDGQAALEEALELRLKHDDHRPYRTKEPYLVPSDVSMAEELYDSHTESVDNPNVSIRRKRKRVAHEDRLFSASCQPSDDRKRLCVNPTRTRENTPGIEDSIPDAPAPRTAMPVKLGLERIDEANETFETTSPERRKLEQQKSHAEEHSKANQPTGENHHHHYHQTHEEVDSSTNADKAGHGFINDKTRLLRDEPSNVAQGVDGQTIHESAAQDLTRSDVMDDETLGQGDTSASIEIGRGVRPSLDARDESSMMMMGDFSSPNNADENSGIGSLMSNTPHSPCPPPQHLGLTRQPASSRRRSPSFPNTKRDVVPFLPNQINGESPSSFRYDVPEFDSSTNAADSPHQGKLPTTDLTGALSTLEPGKYLSATVIERVLSICCPESARVIDSACFKLYPDDAVSSCLRACGENVARVVAPIHHNNHWTLAILDRQTRLITHYNSLPTMSTFRNALGKALPIFMSSLDEGDATSFSVTYNELGTQNNSYDCGVHVLFTALCAFVDAAPSRSPDTGLWRLIFRALLTEQLQIEQVKTEPQIQSVVDPSKDPDVDETFEAADLESHKVRLTKSRLRVASAETAVDLLNQISNQIVTSSLSWSQLPDISQRFLSSLSELGPYSSVSKSLPSLTQSRQILQAGLIKSERIREHSAQAEKCLRAAIGSAQKAKLVRIEDRRRLSLRLQETADAWRNKAHQRMEAAAAQIEASEQLRLLVCEE